MIHTWPAQLHPSYCPRCNSHTLPYGHRLVAGGSTGEPDIVRFYQCEHCGHWWEVHWRVP